MTSTRPSLVTPDGPAPESRDELLDLIDEMNSGDSEFRAEYELANFVQHLLDELVRCRREQGLTQTDVARAMNVGQPTISGFERESSDPKLSTLLRYARAVKANLRLEVKAPAHASWQRGRVVFMDSYRQNRDFYISSDPAREAHRPHRTVDVAVPV